ncbi:hypothetical protein PHSY_002098 [Pseudozyma hubeiensis SY62]|uniref:Uncharacterized protein n=1 Tax=Pseudozyma hubeiensis (strain SY62) TaxID=1305764 RepID=R9P078_PSEHS|nr:hypothetical protein PHSY_002098 [Pseudozyma hubeiensis SY62]GAC94526.1 hypothetical protein PHSY_002098 [Pseudozyma hubeiensis SY62]
MRMKRANDGGKKSQAGNAGRNTGIVFGDIASLAERMSFSTAGPFFPAQQSIHRCSHHEGGETVARLNGSASTFRSAKRRRAGEASECHESCAVCRKRAGGGSDISRYVTAGDRA